MSPLNEKGIHKGFKRVAEEEKFNPSRKIEDKMSPPTHRFTHNSMVFLLKMMNFLPTMRLPPTHRLESPTGASLGKTHLGKERQKKKKKGTWLGDAGSPGSPSTSTSTSGTREVRIDAVCFVYTCRRLIDLAMIAGTLS